jgi:hypothetical protein
MPYSTLLRWQNYAHSLHPTHIYSQWHWLHILLLHLITVYLNRKVSQLCGKAADSSEITLLKLNLSTMLTDWATRKWSFSNKKYNCLASHEQNPANCMLPPTANKLTQILIWKQTFPLVKEVFVIYELKFLQSATSSQGIILPAKFFVTVALKLTCR